MRPGLLLALPLALSLFLVLPGRARAFAQAESYSPGGRYVLLALPDAGAREEGHGLLTRGRLVLVDTRTGREAGAYAPHARGFEVLWSPDGRLVAVNADLGELDGELTVWRVGASGWRLAHLPPVLRRGEGGVRALDRLIPRAYAGRLDTRADGAIPIAERWLGPADLRASLALDGRERRHEVLASFSVVIRFFRLGCEILEERRTSFKVL